MRSDERAKAKAAGARRGYVGAEQNTDLAIQVDRMLAPLMKRFSLVAEKVEVMNGDRQNAAGKTVVRYSNLSPLSDIGKGRSKKAAGSAPTKAEFDALADDVREIREALLAISAQLNGL